MIRDDLGKLTGDYNRSNYMGGVSGFDGLEKLTEDYSKDVSNSDLIKKAGEYLGDDTGRSNPLAFAESAPTTISEHLKNYLRLYAKRLANYTGNNLKAVLGEFNGDGLYALLHQIPLQKTGDSLTDKVTGLIGEKHKLGAIAREGPQAQIRYVLAKYEGFKKEAEDRKDDVDADYWETRKVSFLNSITLDSRRGEVAFNSYAQTSELELQKTLSERGKLDKGIISKVIEGSIGKSRAKYDAEADADKKEKIWNEELLMPYLGIAKILHAINEEKMKKQKKNP